MSAALDLATPDPRLASLLADYPPTLFDDRLYQSSELIERYVLGWAGELVKRFDLVAPLTVGSTTAALLAERRLVPTFAPALAWLLDRLAFDDYLTVETTDRGERHYRLGAKGLPPFDRQGLRDRGVAIDPGNSPTFDLLDAGAEVYPLVAAGTATGEEALLGPAHIGLWLRYFDNANTVYAIANRLSALVVARHLPHPAPRPQQVLEIGAGSGSATLALLEELERQERLDDLGSYRVTEPGQFFRRRAERTLRAAHPTAPLTFGGLDIDQSWESQGVAPGSVDLLYGVNVVHVARNLRRTLGEARRALVPGGWLVAGECLRPFPGQPTFAELVFRLFAGFTSVDIDPVLRPTAGFLTPEQWTVALADAGFEDIQIHPDLPRIREIFPRFAVGAMCARRPLTD